MHIRFLFLHVVPKFCTLQTPSQCTRNSFYLYLQLWHCLPSTAPLSTKHSTIVYQAQHHCLRLLCLFDHFAIFHPGLILADEFCLHKRCLIVLHRTPCIVITFNVSNAFAKQKNSSNAKGFLWRTKMLDSALIDACFSTSG